MIRSRFLLIRMAMVLVFGAAILPTMSGCHRSAAQKSQAQSVQMNAAAKKINAPKIDVVALLPRGAVVREQLEVDFRHDGSPASVVAVYVSPHHDPDPDEYVENLGVFDFVAGKGWTETYSEDGAGLGPHEEVEIIPIKSASGKEGVLEITMLSGAGTTTLWSVLTVQNGKLVSLESEPLRKRLLDGRGYVFMGYNSVDWKSQEIVDQIPGYSKDASRMCTDKPTLEVHVVFTGDSLQIRSVRELKDTVCATPDGPYNG